MSARLASRTAKATGATISGPSRDARTASTTVSHCAEERVVRLRAERVVSRRVPTKRRCADQTGATLYQVREAMVRADRDLQRQEALIAGLALGGASLLAFRRA